MTLAMPEELAIPWLKRLNVAGVGLANNHAFDLGPSGYAETTRALDAAGIRWFGQGDDAGAARPRRRRPDRHRHQRLAAGRPAHAGAARPAGTARTPAGRSSPSSIGAASTSPSRRSAKGCLPTRCGCARCRRSSARIRMSRASGVIALGGGDVARGLFARQFPVRPVGGAIVGHAGRAAGLRAGHDLRADDPAAEFLRHGPRLIKRQPEIARTGTQSGQRKTPGDERGLLVDRVDPLDQTGA